MLATTRLLDQPGVAPPGFGGFAASSSTTSAGFDLLRTYTTQECRKGGGGGVRWGAVGVRWGAVVDATGGRGKR